MVELDELRAYVEYFRDLGVYEFYRRGDGSLDAEVRHLLGRAPSAASQAHPGTRPLEVPPLPAVPPEALVAPLRPRNTVPSKPSSDVTLAASASALEIPIPKPIPFDDLAPLPGVRVPAAERGAALEQLRHTLGDCTRCPLAYAGRHTIVFGEGDASAQLMFVGEGPGADEDASGRPFVGKSGQLLTNMIAAMGLTRESVYIANVVKCRPPNNRAPEPVEANTCSQFLLEQIDIVQPAVIVALGSTAASYLLGARQSLASLRGRFHACRGAKLAITFHPAFLLRDPRQKGEAWRDLQMVMAELGLKASAKPQA